MNFEALKVKGEQILAATGDDLKSKVKFATRKFVLPAKKTGKGAAQKQAPQAQLAVGPVEKGKSVEEHVEAPQPAEGAPPS